MINNVKAGQRRVALSTGIELDVQICGDPANPALLFLHGFPESHRTWRHQVAHFSDHFYCIAPDQRGYRGSSKPQEVAAYTPDKLTADVFALADALGVEEFTIVGHDWGGAIAWAVALFGQAGAPNPAWAGRVPRAVIANAPHPYLFQRLLLGNQEQRASSQYMREFRDSANDDMIREQGMIGMLRKAVKWDISPAMEQEERDALLADWQNREACFGMLNWYRASPVKVPAMDEEFVLPSLDAAAFPALHIPTLVIWAMDDLALPACNIDGLEKFVPNVRIVPVHDCGHFVPWESPKAVNSAMKAFLT